MNPIQRLREKLVSIEEKLSYAFEKKELLVLAFVHRSFVNEHRDLVSEHNERLEFLGDSVLGLIVADYLYHRFPTRPEGELSQLRSRLVDAQSCVQYLLQLELSDSLLLGKGEQKGQAKSSILADAFEALIGAVYLDGGLSMAKSFFLYHFEQAVEKTIGTPSRNFKAELQDYSQKKYQKTPVYKVVQETGPDHAKVFHVLVYVDEQEMGLGIGMSKKEAEQRAAFEALTKLGVQ